jgi:hypothetical protein
MTDKQMQEPVAWGVFEGGNLHDMFFSKEEAEHMALLKGSHAEVRPLYTTPPAQPAVQEPVFKPCSCRWKGEEQVQQCTLHAAHIEAIHEWAERAKAAEAKLKEKTNEQ